MCNKHLFTALKPTKKHQQQMYDENLIELCVHWQRKDNSLSCYMSGQVINKHKSSWPEIFTQFSTLFWLFSEKNNIF